MPILKKGCPLQPSNYRPISLIDIPQKVFGRILLDRIQLWEEENQILSNLQAGFRSGISTIDQILWLQVLFWKTVSVVGVSLYLIFVDLRAVRPGPQG